MVAARANWKGYIKFGEVACAVALYTAASSSERISFNTLNRATGNRVRREFVDSETGDPVERDDQVKGYEIENGDFVVLEPEEIAAAVPESDKTLKIEAFVPCDEIDDVYFDKPYYLAPDKMGADAFRLLRDGMRQAKVAALARTVLFRRLRSVLIRPHGKGLIGTTLSFDYEVRSAKEAFDDIPKIKIEGECSTSPSTSSIPRRARSTRRASTIVMTQQSPNWLKPRSRANRCRKSRCRLLPSKATSCRPCARARASDRARSRNAPPRSPSPAPRSRSAPIQSARPDRRTPWPFAPTGKAF
jgi:Ku protein